MVTAVMTFFSTFTSPLLSALFTLCVVVSGHLSADLFEFARHFGGAGFNVVSSVAYYVLPNLSLFNVRSEAVHGLPLMDQYVLVGHHVRHLLYALLASRERADLQAEGRRGMRGVPAAQTGDAHRRGRRGRRSRVFDGLGPEVPLPAVSSREALSPVGEVRPGALSRIPRNRRRRGVALRRPVLRGLPQGESRSQVLPRSYRHRHVARSSLHLRLSLRGARRFGGRGAFDDGMDILKRGMSRNPTSWQLPFEIGFLNFVNRRDNALAGRYFELASKLPGAPEYAERFAAFVYSKRGRQRVRRSECGRSTRSTPTIRF